MDKNKTAYKVLRLLANGRFHSGQALAKSLDITRSGVWKAIQQLQSLGLEVHAVTGKGYRLLMPLDLLDRTTVQAGLISTTQQALGELHVMSSLPSTNDFLLEQASFSASNRVCLSEHQSKGRGRRGRDWMGAYASGINLSVLWHFQQDAFTLMGLSLAVAVAVVRALTRYGIASGLSVKWPNDILWQHQKLGGILIDLIAEPHAPCKAVIGIGLNTALPADISKAVDQPIIDIFRITEQPPRRNHLAILILEALTEALQTFEQEGLASFLSEWNRLDALLNQPVVVHMPHATVQGVMRGVSARGELQLELPSGETQIFLSGEVSLRRA